LSLSFRLENNLSANTGLLVSSSWVLSAGHCHSSRRVNAALIGNYKFERKNGRSRRIFSKEENVQTLYIDKVFIHPDFQILKSRFSKESLEY